MPGLGHFHLLQGQAQKPCRKHKLQLFSCQYTCSYPAAKYNPHVGPNSNFPTSKPRQENSPIILKSLFKPCFFNHLHDFFVAAATLYCCATLPP